MSKSPSKKAQKKLTKADSFRISAVAIVFCVVAACMTLWVTEQEKYSLVQVPGHGHSHSHPAPYKDGVPMILLPENREQWEPVRANFIKAILSEGNLYENAKDYSTDIVQDKLKHEPDGAYATEKLPDDIEALDIQVVKSTPYEYEESYHLESGRRLAVNIAYVHVGNNKYEWLVYDYVLYDFEDN